MSLNSIDAAFQEGVNIALKEIVAPVWQELTGGVPPGKVVLDPEETVRLWREEEARDPFHSEWLRNRVAELSAFDTDEQNVYLQAWKEKIEADRDVAEKEAKLQEQAMRMPQVPVGMVTQYPSDKHPGALDVAYERGFPLEAPDTGSPDMVIHSGVNKEGKKYVMVGTDRPDIWVNHFAGTPATLEYEDGNGWVTLAELDQFDVLPLEPIVAGQVIGTAGKMSESGTGVHLEAGYNVPGTNRMTA